MSNLLLSFSVRFHKRPFCESCPACAIPKGAMDLVLFRTRVVVRSVSRCAEAPPRTASYANHTAAYRSEKRSPKG
jgi:hypothetical protein